MSVSIAAGRKVSGRRPVWGQVSRALRAALANLDQQCDVYQDVVYSAEPSNCSAAGAADAEAAPQHANSDSRKREVHCG